MKRTCSLTVIGWIGLAVIAVMPAILQAQQTPRQLFERARISEESGQLPDAIKLYEQVVAQSNGNQELAARAQYQIGLAYEKLGSPEANKAYEQVLTKYVKEPVAEAAKQRLAALNRPVELVERRICSGCGGGGSIWAGHFSPDGRQLVSLSNRGIGLVVRDIALGKETQISDDWPGHAIFSADVKQIVYSCCPFNGKGRLGLNVVANKPGATPKVLNDNPEYSDLIPVAWTPDGKSILVVAEMMVDRTWMLAWVSASDGSVKPLKSLGWRFELGMSLPALSPDGRYIAYAASVSDRPPGTPGQAARRSNSPNSGDVHIYVLAADGSSEEIQLVKGASINQHPTWMPDGKSLLFVSDRGGKFGLWSVSLQDRSLKQVKADFGGNINRSVVSPSGDYLFLRSVSGQGQFVVSKRGANSGEQILSGTAPAWSPDSKAIAFIRTKDNISLSRFSVAPVPMAALLVYSLDTRDEKRYVPNTELGGVFSGPVWSHDGKFLLQVITDSRGIRSLYRVDLKTEEFKQVAGNVGTDFVALSSDDKTFYMIDRPSQRAGNRTMITAIDLSSGRQTQIVSLPRLGSPEGVILSSDQKMLYSAGCDESCGEGGYGNGIVSVDLATGVQKQILSSQDPDGGLLSSIKLSLSPDGRTLAFIGRSKGPPSTLWKLYRIGVTGDGYRKLADLNSEAKMSWSGDGSILFLEDNEPKPINVPRNGNDPEVRSVAACIPTINGGNVCSPDGLHVINPRGIYVELSALDNVSSFLANRQ